MWFHPCWEVTRFTWFFNLFPFTYYVRTYTKKKYKKIRTNSSSFVCKKLYYKVLLGTYNNFRVEPINRISDLLLLSINPNISHSFWFSNLKILKSLNPFVSPWSTWGRFPHFFFVIILKNSRITNSIWFIFLWKQFLFNSLSIREGFERKKISKGWF
jgi:hypothetical protein